MDVKFASKSIFTNESQIKCIKLKHTDMHMCIMKLSIVLGVATHVIVLQVCVLPENDVKWLTLIAGTVTALHFLSVSIRRFSQFNVQWIPIYC